MPHTNKELFDYKSYIQLIKAEKDPDVLEYIEDTIKVCCNYVKAVDMMETQIVTARMRMDQEKYQTFIQNIDTHRRALHNDAIESTSFLNRIAERNGIEKIFKGNKENRYEVADFCLQVVTEIFNNR